MNEYLEEVDFLFAKAILEQGPGDALVFLATLFHVSREGHLCLKIEGKQITPPLPLEMQEAVIKGATHAHLFAESVVKEGACWYLRRHFETLQTFLAHFKRLKEASVETVFPQEALDATALAQEQKEALRKVATQPLTLISGGPGTGKTFLASTLLSLFPGKKAVGAPTGKAAANLRKKTEGVVVKTLHALVKEPYWPYDLVLIDEASMVDGALMAALFSKVKTGARLVLLGDAEQLPPVEPGNFFTSLLQLHQEGVCFLHTCYRAELKEVIEFTLKIKNENNVPLQPLTETNALVKEIVQKMGEISFASLSRFRALSALKKGPFGVDALNQLLYQKMKNQPWIPLILTENNKELGLFNGDTALLKEGMAYFEDGRKVSLHRLPRYEWAYVLSVHKSQGSEYEEVMVLLPDGAESFGKEMLYTAVTRAKKKVSLWGKEETYRKMVSKHTERVMLQPEPLS